jgi:hypothetical protein
MRHGRCGYLVQDMAGERTPRDHDRTPSGRGLYDPRPTKGLGRSLAATAWDHAYALFDPYGELAHSPDVRQGHRRQRQKRRGGRALELTAAHFAA